MHAYELQCWLAAIAMFFVLDAASTIAVLSVGGVETSTPALWFYQTWGPVGLVPLQS
jgi:hypothetical protein